MSVYRPCLSSAVVQRRDGGHKTQAHDQRNETANAQFPKPLSVDNNDGAGVAHTGGCLQARQAG